MTARAVEAYPDLEQRSGIPFHEPVGCLIAPALAVTVVAPIRSLSFGTRVSPMTGGLQANAGASGGQQSTSPPPMLSHEPGPAGYIRPKRLIDAQEALPPPGGDRRRRHRYRHRPEGPGHMVTTVSGQRFHASHVAVATGAFTNLHRLLPEPAPLRLKTEVIILGEVNEDDAERLGRYPVVKYLNDGDDLDAIYMTPPVRYPDGRHCIKMGANIRLDTWPDDLPTIQRWFESATDDDYLPLLGPAPRPCGPRSTSSRCAPVPASSPTPTTGSR